MNVFQKLVIFLIISTSALINASQKDGLRFRKHLSGDNKAEPKKYDQQKRKKTPEEIDQIKKEICLYKVLICCLKTTKCCIKPACRYLCKKNK
jgi:hypothetical protein